MMEIPTLSHLQHMPSQSAAISRYKSIASATVHCEIMKPNCALQLAKVITAAIFTFVVVVLLGSIHLFTQSIINAHHTNNNLNMTLP